MTDDDEEEEAETDLSSGCAAAGCKHTNSHSLFPSNTQVTWQRRAESSSIAPTDWVQSGLCGSRSHQDIGAQIQTQWKMQDCAVWHCQSVLCLNPWTLDDSVVYDDFILDLDVLWNSIKIISLYHLVYSHSKNWITSVCTRAKRCWGAWNKVL